MSKRAIFVFLGTLIAAAWIVQWAGLRAVGGDLSNEAVTPYLIAAMFMPTIWSLGLIAFSGQARRSVAWRPGRLSALVLAPLIPAAIAFATLAIAARFGFGASSYFAFPGEGAEILKGPWKLGLGEQAWPLFIANMAATAIWFGVFNGTVAVGEEFGWRGLLQPNMIRQFGLMKGVSLLGVVWAFWHLPMNLAGYNYSEHALLGTFVLFPLSLVAHSFILAALTIWARSFWPAVFFHGSVNGIYEGVTSSIESASGVSPLVIDLIPIGLEVVLAIIAIALLKALWRRDA